MADPRRVVEIAKNPRVAIPAGAVLLTGATAGILGFFLKQWIYVVAALLVLLVVLIAYLIWAFYARERDQRVARGTGAPDDLTLMGHLEERRDTASLEDGFRKSIAIVEARGLGNLPWYLVVGAPGAGKTLLLRASGLDLPPAVERFVERGPTRACNYWLTNQAVVLDTAGRLTSSHEGPDQKEWLHLLSLVRKHRRAPALHGVLVVLSAADLLEKNAAQLESDASELRRQLNRIVDRLGVDPPIYLMVSQSDRVQGFAELGAALGPERIREALGWTNRERKPPDVGQAVRDAFSRMRSRVEGALPELLVGETDGESRRRLFLLPQELAALGAATALFAGRVFRYTRYEELPFLRGIYLTSALREGTLVSTLRDGGAPALPVAVAGPAGGWFVRDFFRRLLLDSEEQSLAVVTDRVGPRTRGVLIGLATAAALVLVGLWAVSFWRGWSSMAAVRDAAIAAKEQRRSLDAVEALRESIARAEAGQEGRFDAFRAPLERALDRGRRGFVALYGREFEEPAKSALLGAVREDDTEAFAALQDLAADVAFLATRGREARVAPNVHTYSEASRNEAERKAFDAGYASYVRWAPDADVELRIDTERERLEEAAPRLLDITRLEAWCASHREDVPGVSYRDVGLAGSKEPGGHEVSGCYTRAFYEEQLVRLVASLERSVANENVDRFRDDYGRRFAESWEGFLVGAPRPALADPDIEHSPYLALIARVDENTRAEGLWRAEAPSWVRTLHAVRDTGEPAAEAEPEADTDAEERGKKGAKKKKELPPWKRYEALLDRAGVAVERARGSSQRALEEARRVADGEETPFQQTLELVRNDLVPIAPEEESRVAKTALRSVLLMPVLNGFSAVLVTAAREVDQVWKNQVVAPFPPPLTAEAHAARQAAITRFKSETLAPFWLGSAPKPLLEDRALPLSDPFVAALGGRAAGGSASGADGGGGGGGGGSTEVLPPIGPETVRLAGAPSEVAGASDVFVTSQELTLICAGQPPQRFEYSDGVGEKAFLWRSDCDLVQLTVRARSSDGREIEMAREWSGQFAFADFLETGPVWSVSDEGGSGVRVSVRYTRRGGEKVIAHKRAMSRALPPSAIN